MAKETKLVVTYGNGDAKKGSVRMKPQSVEGNAVKTEELGDYYVSRAVMNKLGLADTDAIKVTFEKA